MQIHIASEETKFGFDDSEIRELIHSDECSALKNIKITGLMGMATNTSDEDQVVFEFRTLKALYESIKKSSTPENIELNTLSMGMSGDYKIALNEGSNMVRIGSLIFGSRNY